MKMKTIVIVFMLVFIVLVCLSALYSHTSADAGATSSVHIAKYSADGSTVLAETTVDYRWMEENLPVHGDGITHYYHQGPVFEGDMWDTEEMTNLKDKGAVKGTDIKDLCELVGGMALGDELMIAAVDGYHLKFAYENIYQPDDRQGPVVLCWYKAEDPDYAIGHGYPGNNAYSDAMQIVFFSRTMNPEGKYVFGNSDMRACLPDEKYQHFFEGLPSTNGLSGKWINEIYIYPVGVQLSLNPAQSTIEESADSIAVTTVVLGCLGLVLIGVGGGIYLIHRRAINRAS